MVSRALSPRTPSEGACELSEASEVLRLEQAQAPPSQGAQQEVPLQVTQIDEVLPVHGARLGRGRNPSLSSGLQHAQPADSQKELELPPSRLQLQSQACEDPDHKGKEEVAFR